MVSALARDTAQHGGAAAGSGAARSACLKLKYDKPLSNFAVNFNLRHYIQGPVNLGVKEADYEWLTEELCKIANTCCQGRIISVLEGGYRIQVGACSLTVSSPMLKAPMVSALEDRIS